MDDEFQSSLKSWNGQKCPLTLAFDLELTDGLALFNANAWSTCRKDS